MIWLLGGVIIAATLAFIGLWFAAMWAYDLLRDRYQARRKHVLHTTAADERIVAERQSMGRLRELPAPGLSIYTDQNVRLPRTPGPATWTPPAHALEAVSKRYPRPEPGPPVVASVTDARPSWSPPRPHEPYDDPFVRALLTLPVDRVHEAFSTGQFPAVTA